MNQLAKDQDGHGTNFFKKSDKLLQTAVAVQNSKPTTEKKKLGFQGFIYCMHAAAAAASAAAAAAAAVYCTFHKMSYSSNRPARPFKIASLITPRKFSGRGRHIISLDKVDKLHNKWSTTTSNYSNITLRASK
jgi:hypothetical protein